MRLLRERLLPLFLAFALCLGPLSVPVLAARGSYGPLPFLACQVYRESPAAAGPDPLRQIVAAWDGKTWAPPEPVRIRWTRSESQSGSAVRTQAWTESLEPMTTTFLRARVAPV